MSIIGDYKFSKNRISFPYRGCAVVKKDTILIEMGNRLRYQRKQMKLTQEKLAEISGLSVKTIISAEKGKKGLRPENIVCLCQVLDMDISYFMIGRALESVPAVSLSHQERIALDKILEAFFSICNQKHDL